MSRRALLSVSDKSNLVDFAKQLKDLDFEIVSTGGTKKALEDAGVEVTGVEEVTGFPEMLDGRVKTLHPKIHAGILAKRDDPDHMKQLKDAGITPIDLVAVNLYPFKQTIEKPETTQAEAIEQIDIGGPSMLRAAAKNFAGVLTVVDPADYQPVIDALKEHKDDADFRKHLAAKVFRHTAAYDALISNYLTDEEFPEKLTLTYEKQQSLRYGENSHQKAAFYRKALPSKLSIIPNQLHGKELSYNNIKDANAALNMVAEFDQPTVIAMKHMNPCGVGVADTIEKAWDEAYESDPMSIFGGIIAVNREIDAATAEKMHKIFLEIVIAPSYTDEAFEILAKKKNIRLLKADLSHRDEPDRFEEITVSGGMLIQESDHEIDQIPDFKVVTKVQPTEQQLKALQFGQHVVKHVKSNAVVVTTDTKTLGVGMGQPNRIDSAKIAIQKAMPKDGYENAIMASDAFFPMDDCVEYAAKHDIKAIIQPGGSIKDKDSIAMADKFGIAMVMTGVRHFRH
ncbi:bifunctional phosphoribosylaminoimidazolecarboxamide formyltransferase/IMP cyclohydrolase [Lentilactobacillus otakiensis]|uniref:Bifunctional purine biosynthesis protein PurH n=1 Tax=Lentilactobacillus otakiensis DSM 19908 = JCM 15040 TaxID=1423780 RepID=S4PP25_9LACO|nr:bifunctional phosphoribosylaminoimidazolecarboxamide formyltransferase/IMP cyclohydrolase [Lentilactobacillus otakiensis]KRL10352.1 bifunctional purine biosynthesis protein purH [Lentilactobacillus otakiensis DSM 19908 = JCM 15040]MBZ3777020.1 bifunctional phosphoribosylaminoimidazolecarboxamide formyltransferase/IMP cyclohydrolase [Lentilactobacillus otakiensis]MDV3518043.1 bifunctional phosphoribosylaminoimidazolecarboxamide formyltransferase/IMP cyclohydrolase [Lentilactobacillus otakiensi